MHDFMRIWNKSFSFSGILYSKNTFSSKEIIRITIPYFKCVGGISAYTYWVLYIICAKSIRG